MKRAVLYMLLVTMTMSCAAWADIIRIDDRGETLSVSLINDNPMQVGSISTPVISQAQELVSFTYTLPVGIEFTDTFDVYRQLIDRLGGDDTPGKISDI